MSYASFILEQMKPRVPAIPANVETYSSPKMAAFRPNIVFEGPARFQCYEFMLTGEGIPNIKVENKLFTIDRKSFMSINPMQSHGSLHQQIVDHYVPIFVDRHMFNENAYAIAGTTDIQFCNTPFFYSEELLNIVNSFMRESSTKQIGQDFVIQSIATQFVAYVIRNSKSSINSRISTRCYKEDRNMNQVIDYLWENYDKDFSFEDIAKTINYSPYHFIRIFKDVTGKTPHEYLIDIKIHKAMNQLKFSSNTITEVCYHAGFNNLNHFSSLFKKRTGVSPTEYRKSIKSQ